MRRCLAQWQRVVGEVVLERAVEEWRNGVRAGKKLGPYVRVEEERGFEEYLEGVLGKGEVLLGRFRSGSAAVGEETGRWYGGRTGVWVEDGTERTGERRCGTSDEGVG